MSDDFEPNAAAVFFQEKDAGRLFKRPDGYLFRYNGAYLKSESPQPVSLTLPLRSEDYTSPTIFPFFEGLLPEGWLLDLTTSTYHIDKNDKFKLLLHTGQDAIGAVSVWPLKRNTNEPAKDQ